MEPIPETHEALVELERYGDMDLRQDLEELTTTARESVPGLVGVSLALLTDDLVLTYVASDYRIATLDGVQYVDDGPCVEAIREDNIILTDTAGLLDESTWLLFAQATAAAGIRSTLSMPFRRSGVVTGGVNLYGSEPGTFHGKTEVLAELFGAWAPGAVTNADLSFESRLEAVKSPERLRGQAFVDHAVGLLMSARGLSPDDAERRLQAAAARAGVAVFVLARALVEVLSPEE
ncbi:GAF domain-containing protein [Terrabacter sp. LjRoot27]|uniref:GAF domain-containing protein n=1 Tax=Terrabacter sp. LjRoot27 TaxID=3342306 RepID=UPI003ED014A0